MFPKQISGRGWTKLVAVEDPEPAEAELPDLPVVVGAIDSEPEVPAKPDSPLSAQHVVDGWLLHVMLLDISYPANGVGFREDGGRGLPNVKARAPGLAETSSPTPAEHGSSAIVDGMPRHRCW